MRKSLFALILACLALMPLAGIGAAMNGIEFNYLLNSDGLSSSRVNAILKDSRGFLWLGTQSGLNRFDGFRFRKFYYSNSDTTSIPNNSIAEIQEAANGDLWVKTDVGYTVYDHEKECFDRHPERKLHSLGVQGVPQRIFIDSDKNIWMFVSGIGCYYLNVKSKELCLFSTYHKGATHIPKGEIDSFTEVNGFVVLNYKDGILCKVDGKRRRVLWVNRYLAKLWEPGLGSPCTYIDSKYNYWVSCNNCVFVYSSAQKKWFSNVQSFLHSQGIVPPTTSRILIKDLKEDKQRRIWIATDHNGLLLLDMDAKRCSQYLATAEPGGISDNTLQTLFVDERGVVWIGTYKSGVAVYSPSATKFTTIPLGDICTIAQDKEGNLWCGTNDAGIVCYQPTTGRSIHYSGMEVGMGSEVVVSSVVAHDGSVYFGGFNGGMLRYAKGQWTAYHADGKPGHLGNNNVWALAEDKRHRILVGTLGSGLQVFDPQTETFAAYGVEYGEIPDYVNSLYTLPNGNVVIGHSQNFSVIEASARRVTHFEKPRGKGAFISPSVNDAMMDSRGIYWVATPAGIYMYDPHNGQMITMNELNGTEGFIGCSVIEGSDHTMWLVSEFQVSHVVLGKDKDGRWNIFTTNYNALDGLQSRQFNYRSTCLTHEGNIVIGGQDGISIINPRSLSQKKTHVKALFTELVLFGHSLLAGEKYEGRTILERSLDTEDELRLSHKDNTFTIQLATNEVTVPARCRFLYQVDGISDKWLLTSDGSPSITFTNLSPGNYMLRVKVVNGDGSVNDEVSKLKIHISPPFYRSWVAVLFYIFLIGVAYHFVRRHDLQRQKEAFERQQMEEDIRKTKELNELKLNFFTNVSHELRSPLSLIISPITMLIKEETDEGKRRRFELILRSANRLLAMVNQILDIRRLDIGKDKLDLSETDFVAFTQNICNSFKMLANNMITLHFTSNVRHLEMSFDIDKMGKIVNNLLSNAYKFTPDGGSITVEICVDEEMRMVRLSVADTGKGIPDEDKEKVFERFYQVDGTKMQPYGGSGIGLNLVQGFTVLHGGSVSITDNPGGGAIFIVDLPIRSSGKHVVERTLLPSVETTSGEAVSSFPIAGSASKPLVLLVDDSDDFREFMRSILEENYQVQEAVDGKDALDKIQKCRPDVILSDVMMPVMDGNQLCRAVKGDSSLADIPFVMLTARLAQKQKLEGYESGADDYITKPFDIELLNLRVRNLLKRTSRVLPPEPSETEKVALAAEPVALEKEVAGDASEYVMTESDRRFMAQVDKYIQDNLGDPDASVEAMSRYLCVSRVSLYKRLVSFTGTTPSEYIRAKRIKHAEKYVREGEYNISEIAYMVGFNSPRYFSKYFHDVYGMTPTEYRKKMMG